MKKRLLAMLLAVSLLTGLLAVPASADSTASAADDSAWQEQFTLGEQYLAAGEYQSAISAFVAAFQIDPTREEASLKLAEAKLAAAEAYLEQAEAYLSLEDTEANRNRALSYLNNALIYDYTTAASKTDLYLLMAERLNAHGDYIKALELLEDMITGARVELLVADDAVYAAWISTYEILEQNGSTQSATDAALVQQVRSLYLDELLEAAAFVEEGMQSGSAVNTDNGLFSDDLREFLSSLEEVLIMELDNGKYLALYPGMTYYAAFVYYGDMEDYMRSGYGIWFTETDEIPNISLIKYSTMAYVGYWEKDMANGHGKYTDEGWRSYEVEFADGYGTGEGIYNNYIDYSDYPRTARFTCGENGEIENYSELLTAATLSVFRGTTSWTVKSLTDKVAGT